MKLPCLRNMTAILAIFSMSLSTSCKSRDLNSNVKDTKIVTEQKEGEMAAKEVRYIEDKIVEFEACPSYRNSNGDFVKLPIKTSLDLRKVTLTTDTEDGNTYPFFSGEARVLFEPRKDYTETSLAQLFPAEQVGKWQKLSFGHVNVNNVKQATYKLFIDLAPGKTFEFEKEFYTKPRIVSAQFHIRVRVKEDSEASTRKLEVFDPSYFGDDIGMNCKPFTSFQMMLPSKQLNQKNAEEK